MATAREQFWKKSSFAFVGHSAAKPFPAMSYGKAKQLGKKVFAVDTSVSEVGASARCTASRVAPRVRVS